MTEGKGFRMRTNGERGKENREVEDRARTRTADKGHMETRGGGIFWIEEVHGVTKKKSDGGGGSGKGKPRETPTDTNGRTGSKTDWQASKSCTSEMEGRGGKGRRGGERGKKDERGGGCCSQRGRYVRSESGPVRPSLSPSLLPATSHLSVFSPFRTVTTIAPVCYRSCWDPEASFSLRRAGPRM